MIKLVEVTSAKQRRQFVKFPFSLYRDSPYWIAPIIQQEYETFDVTKNPYLQRAQITLFLAMQKNNVVGRIAIIINENDLQSEDTKKLRFGWLDFIDDLSVSEALLNKAREVAMAHNLPYLEGPMGFSNMDKVGMLTSGFDQLGSMLTNYNFEYYNTHLKLYGFSPEKEFHEKAFAYNNVDLNYYERISKVIQKRMGVKEIHFSSTRDVMERIDELFDVFNQLT